MCFVSLFYGLGKRDLSLDNILFMKQLGLHDERLREPGASGSSVRLTLRVASRFSVGSKRRFRLEHKHFNNSFLHVAVPSPFRSGGSLALGLLRPG